MRYYVIVLKTMNLCNLDRFRVIMLLNWRNSVQL